MRKRNINFIFDHFLWYVLYMLPLLIYVFALIGQAVGGNDITNFSFVTIMSNLGFTLDGFNPVLGALSDIFGSSGLLPLFDSSPVFIIVSWFVSVMLLHIAVDTLLFLPRLCLHFMDFFKKGED